MTICIPSLQGTLAKRAKPPLQPNFAKEPFRPSHADTKWKNTPLDNSIIKKNASA